MESFRGQVWHFISNLHVTEGSCTHVIHDLLGDSWINNFGILMEHQDGVSEHYHGTSFNLRRYAMKFVILWSRGVITIPTRITCQVYST